VCDLACAQNKELGDWIKETIKFPNSMVDRITPATTDETRKFVKDNYGYEDVSPIFCEPFTQWVLEDKFTSGRPALDKIDSILFVDDVAPYEFRKLRLLNGGHASLSYPAALLELAYVHDAVDHEAIRPFLDCLMEHEIMPTVPGGLPDMTPSEYWESVKERFCNPTIEDTIRRNCFDGASRQPKFIVPVIRDNLDCGRSVEGLALVSAMWCRYCQGKTDKGAVIEPNDPQWDRLHDLALKAKDKPALWVQELRDVYGSVSDSSKFAEDFTKAMTSIQNDGVAGALKKYSESKSGVPVSQ
jgi:mannitol 2-dehydrogenase